MTKKELRLAGYLALFNSIITLPVFFFALVLETGKRTVTTSVQLALMSVICTAITIYLIVELKKYVCMKTSSCGINKPVTLLVYGYLTSIVLNTVNIFLMLDAKAVAVLTIVTVLVLGSFQAYLGVCVYRLEDNLNGFKKSYAILLFATGVLSASVVLFPISLFSSAVSDIMLGTIFLQAAKESNVASLPES